MRIVSTLALLLVVTGCRHDGFWNHKRSVPARFGNPNLEPASDTDQAISRVAGKYGDFQQIFADVAEAALPAVVSIHSEKEVNAEDSPVADESFDFFFGGPESGAQPHREEGLGSGVIIDSDGTILTNNHVIAGADRIRVQLYDDREFDAEVLGADPASDLAVIRVKDAKGRFTSMPLGDSDRLRIGEWVLAVGSPYGLSQTVTTGIISAKGRHNTGINSYENFLQTDAAINPGNSGGALVNLKGELVGINTAIFSRSGGYQGIGFAIPISMARKISADLIRDGRVTRGWLGVSIQPLEPELAAAIGAKDRRGALVGGIVSGSPADVAGLRRGDVILGVGKRPIQDPNDLLNYIALQPPGSWIEVNINREGRNLVFKVKVARRDESRMAGLQGREERGAPEAPALGLRLADLSPDLRGRYRVDSAVTRGAVVIGVARDSRASRARLREGDVIVEANRTRVLNAEGFDEVMKKSSKGNRILLLVNRNGGTFFTTF